MAKHLETGKIGEEIAKGYLESQGFSVVETNWRWGKGEIDIIAWSGEILVFVEVKTRSAATFGNPEDAVTEKKQQLMYELATEYMYRQRYENEIRFDIVAITLTNPPDIRHYADAFFPTW